MGFIQQGAKGQQNPIVLYCLYYLIRTYLLLASLKVICQMTLNWHSLYYKT